MAVSLDPTKVVYCNEQEAKIFWLLAQSFAQMLFTESSKPCEWRAQSQCERKNHERKAYQSIKAVDFQSFLNLLAEDVQWQLPAWKMSPSPEHGTDGNSSENVDPSF